MKQGRHEQAVSREEIHVPHVAVDAEQQAGVAARLDPAAQEARAADHHTRPIGDSRFVAGVQARPDAWIAPPRHAAKRSPQAVGRKGLGGVGVDAQPSGSVTAPDLRRKTSRAVRPRQQPRRGEVVKRARARCNQSG